MVDPKRNHFREKPHEYYYCREKCIYSGSLVKHKRTRTKLGKPYECDICKRDLHSLATWFDINKFTLEKIKPYECNDADIKCIIF